MFDFLQPQPPGIYEENEQENEQDMDNDMYELEDAMTCVNVDGNEVEEEDDNFNELFFEALMILT